MELPRRISGTRAFVAGTNVDLSDPETINWLKASKIAKVFCLYPLVQRQFDDLEKAVKRGTNTMEQFYKGWGINPLFATKLSQAGIMTSSLVRNPNHLREYESFAKEAIVTKGNFLVQCFAGKHASGAYAMYYLAKASPLGLQEIKARFMQSGYSGKDLTMMESFLKNAKIDLNSVIERKNALMEIASQIKIASQIRARKKKKPSKETKGKKIRQIFRKR